MSLKLALKRLTASDLTFFGWHFRNKQAGNQKAINLNADVFVNELYPNLPVSAESRDGRIPLDLYLYGPGLEGELNLQRKIVKGDSYKNWRLNGEYVNNPEESPQRFNSLVPDDFVIFEFRGEFEPSAAKAIFVASSQKEDAALHAVLSQFIGQRRMIAITAADLERLVSSAAVKEQHPINGLLLQRDIEDVAQGGIEGIKRIRSSPYKGRISHELLKRARESASRIGRIGEEFVNEYLKAQKNLGLVSGFIWESEINAIAPYDFSITPAGNDAILTDVKSTEGGFDATLHISMNELLQMVDTPRYDLYRVFEIGANQAQLRIAANVGFFAQEILAVLNQLPTGVRSDGVAINPSVLSFGPAITIYAPQGIDQEDQ